MAHEASERTLSRKYESLDYDLIENVIYLEHQHKARFKTYLAREFFTFFGSDDTVLEIHRVDQQVVIVDRRIENFRLGQIDATLCIDY